MKESKKALKLSSTVFKLREEIAGLELEKEELRAKRNSQLGVIVLTTVAIPVVMGVLLSLSPLIPDDVAQKIFLTGIGIGAIGGMLVIAEGQSLIDKTISAEQTRQYAIKKKQEYLDKIGDDYA